MAELSPMMQQYLEIKNQHKDEILFYRIGDFYEMFFDDAVTASRELDLTLTGKQCGLAERAPMCGVPFHSYEGYVARLIAKGYKVAICEQVEDPAKAKGLVKRDIIRVVTPGTVIESSMLQDDRNNYIASLYLKGKKAGLCFADVSTGAAHITELTADKIAPAVITELCRYHPSEVLLNPGLLDCREVTAYIKKNMSCSVELVEDERYAPGLVASALEEQFGRDWPQTTGIAAEGLVRFAMAALLEYLHDTQIKGVERLKTVITYNEAQFMRLSPVTRANLELSETLRGREKRGTLLWVLDKTSTAMGKRMLRSWIEQPLISSQLINHRLNAVEALVRQTMVRGDLTEELHYIADMERLMTRTVYGSATPKEIYTLAQTCDRLPGLRKQAEGCNCPELAELAASIDPLEDIKARIYAAVDPDAPSTLKDGGVIAKGYHAEVDELRSIRDNTKGVLAQLEARLRQETGIPKLKIGYNHVFGYFIEVSNSYKNLVPETYIRKQTLTSGERYITQELKELESKILGAHERLISLERRLFDELLESIGAQLDRIQRTANAIAQLDVLAALAQVAAENNYCRPVVDDSDVLTITEGRHPVVEQVLKGSMFVPNDARRGEGHYAAVMHAMDLLKKYGIIFGTSICYTRQNIDAVTNDAFMRFLCEKGAHFGFYFHYMPVGNEAAPELMPTPEQRKYMIDRIRYLRSSACDIPFYPMDFQNDGEFVGGCIAGGRNYFHINSAGDAEPCVFIHYSNANIHDQSILEILHSPLFMAYHNGQPFNKNHLRPCPMLENPELLEKMVHETGAHSTDLQSPESVEHLCEKCKAYAADWQPTADEVWSHHKIRESRYENYKDWKPSQPQD